jgi:hypothetical protein
MPVKVRCPGCERVLNAPDRARGKAVKCPDCGKAVRVPAEPAAKPERAAKAERTAKKVAAPPPSSSMLIANLDLDKIEDAHTRICPKCSAEVSAEDIECPECHVNLETGLLSSERQADLTRKGPNPKQYYKEFVSDGISFWKKHKTISSQLAFRSAVLTAMAVLCLTLAVWCVKPLAQDFWLLLCVFLLLIPPGLAWALHVTIIEATMRKKKKLDKYHFDNFLGAALGLKLIFWFLWIALPLHVLAAIFYGLYALRGLLPMLFVAAGLEGVAAVFASLFFPLAMTHMSMPVTIRGWMVHKMWGAFVRTRSAVIYWCGYLALVMFVPIACVATAAAMSGKDFVQVAVDSQTNARNFRLKAESENLPRTAIRTQEQMEAERSQQIPVHFERLILPSGLLVAAAAIFGASAVFLMRTNGQYARYFLPSLDLETMAPEVTYVPKSQTLDDLDGEKKKLTWKPVIMVLGLAFVMGISLGGSFGMSYLRSFAEGVPWGITVVGGLAFLVGSAWLAAAKLAKKKDGKSMVKFAAAVLVAGLVYGGIGGVFLVSSSGLLQGKFEPPAKYVAMPVGFLPFEGSIPEGWEALAGGGMNGIPMSVRIHDGRGSISIEIRESEGSSEKGKMKKNIKEGKEVVQIGGGGANLSKLGEAPAVEATHSYHQGVVMKSFSNYKEGGQRPIKTGFGKGLISDFTAEEGLLHSQVKGCRASVVHRDFQLNIVCKCPPAQFDDVRPVFEKIISSLSPREGPGGGH